MDIKKLLNDIAQAEGAAKELRKARGYIMQMRDKQTTCIDVRVHNAWGPAILAPIEKALRDGEERARADLAKLQALHAKLNELLQQGTL